MRGTLADRLRDAEIRNERVAVAKEDVLGLDIPVDDAPLVRVRQRLRHIAQHLHCGAERQLAVSCQPRAQRLALDERHGVEEQPLAFTGGEQRHDV